MPPTTVRTTLTPLAALEGATADLLVIGGGITGAGIARDAAMRGLDVVLVDQGDLGGGTSSRSSRLLHGGIRYLEQAEFRLVFEALRERAVLIGLAPHLARPLPFLFPLYRGDRVAPWKLRLGLWLYDRLAGRAGLGRHRMLAPRAALAAEPRLRDRGLAGAGWYVDAQCDDARLTVAVARDAIRHGARIATYAAVTDLVRAQGQVRGATVVDRLDGARATIAARVVVNATGPWADAVRRLEDPAARPILRPTKGVHLVVPRARVGHREAIVFLSPVDGRVMFVLPWGEHTYIGTTDTEADATPEAVAATPDDLLYLLRSANALFPSARLTEADVLATWAGLRPLLDPGAARSAGGISREHALLEGPGGMLTIAGGKYTTFRVMAAQAVDRAVRRLRAQGDRRPFPAAPTATSPLPGGEGGDTGGFRSLGQALGLAEGTIAHLMAHYGTETGAVLALVERDRALDRRLAPDHPAIAAEVVFQAERELVRTVDDVLVRRLHLAYETADRGAGARAMVAALLAGAAPPA